ncbi:hypothetical protein GCM10009535_58980 [Streptomyces thermocarboxydovorans]|uniref:Uncharacterized protein n=1 Tax=Streptomyces thermocarboxydovorans TaxID=59298 RepID=A0ABP3T5L7_9ACTN
MKLAYWSAAINGYVTTQDGRPVVVWTVLAGGSAIGRKGTAKTMSHVVM